MKRLFAGPDTQTKAQPQHPVPPPEQQHHLSKDCWWVILWHLPSIAQHRMSANFWIAQSEAQPRALCVQAHLPCKISGRMAHQLACVQHSDLDIAGEELFCVQGTQRQYGTHACLAGHCRRDLKPVPQHTAQYACSPSCMHQIQQWKCLASLMLCWMSLQSQAQQQRPQ